MHKLILLEGIPGSGKSSAGAALQNFLESDQIPSHFWREGDFDHPADFEGVACFNQPQFEALLSRHPALVDLLQEHTSVRGDDYLLKYRKLQALHPQKVDRVLMDECSQLDVYDGLPVDEYCRLALERWRDFCHAKRSDEVTLLECCFLQNPLTVMLARHNADPQAARQHIEKITEIIRALNPLVIYLHPRNVADTLQHVRAQRPKEWADFVTGYLTEQAYGKAHHLSGFDGVIQFYSKRQTLEMDILRSLPIQHLVVEHSGREWDRCEKEIAANWNLLNPP